MNFTDYWKKFRVEKVATENTWGPNSDHMVSMYQSKLYLTQVNVTGTTGTATRGSAILPSWTEYGSDPFWSQDGSLFVFTSYDTPDVGLYNTDGLNGDMKRRGKIAIANADPSGIHDDAHDLVPRMNNITSFYPCISTDNKLVVFNQSSCGTDPGRQQDSDRLRQPDLRRLRRLELDALDRQPGRGQPGPPRRRERRGG